MIHVLKVVTHEYKSLYLPPQLAIHYLKNVWLSCFHPDYPFHIYKIPNFAESKNYPIRIYKEINEFAKYRKLLLCEAEDIVKIEAIYDIAAFRYNRSSSLKELFSSRITIKLPVKGLYGTTRLKVLDEIDVYPLQTLSVLEDKLSKMI